MVINIDHAFILINIDHAFILFMMKAHLNTVVVVLKDVFMMKAHLNIVVVVLKDAPKNFTALL